MSQLDHAQLAKEALEGLVERMGLSVCVAVATDDDGSDLLEVTGDDAENLAHATVIEAVQMLINRMAGRQRGERGPTVFVDAAGYRGRRRAELQEEARRLADEVRDTGRAVAAGRLTSYERRLLHLAIEEEEGVTTRSEGEGRDRRLRVVPA